MQRPGDPDLFPQTDMLVEHFFPRPGGETSQLQFSLNILKLFNQDTATGKFVMEDRSTGPMPDQALFFSLVSKISVTSSRRPGR